MKFIDRADALARRLERFLTGGTPTDPLYVSNRTFGQKLRFALLVAAPLLLVAVVVVLARNNYFDTRVRLERAFATQKPPAAELHAGKDLPISSDYSRDIDVLEAAVSDTDHTLSGKIRNTTGRTVNVADLVFDITDEEGSQLGGVSARVENIPPHAIVNFRVNLDHRNGRAALVREVHSR